MNRFLVYPIRSRRRVKLASCTALRRRFEGMNLTATIAAERSPYVCGDSQRY